MKPILSLLPAVALIACGADQAFASTITNPITRIAILSALEYFAPDEQELEQYAWAETARDADDDQDEPAANREEEDEDDGDEMEERDDIRRPEARAGRGQPPWAREDMAQVRELFQKLRRARAEGKEQEVKELMEELRERAPRFGRPGMEGIQRQRGERFRAEGPPPAGDRPPRERLSERRGNGPRQPAARTARPNADERSGPTARRGRPPRGQWQRPLPGRRGGPATARRAERGQPGRIAQRGQPRQWQRPGPRPGGPPPAMLGPRHPSRLSMGAPTGRGPQGAAPRAELRKLREEMKALRQAIEALTEQVKSATDAD